MYVVRLLTVKKEGMFCTAYLRLMHSLRCLMAQLGMQAVHHLARHMTLSMMVDDPQRHPRSKKEVAATQVRMGLKRWALIVGACVFGGLILWRLALH